MIFSVILPMPTNKNSLFKQALPALSDGMIISLAFVTVLFATGSGTENILKLSAVAGFAGAVLVGIAGFFAARFRMESLTLKTPEEEKRLNAEETEKTIALFKKLDLGTDMQQQAASEIEKDSAEWKAFIEKNDQPFELPDKKQLPVTGFVMGMSYLAGALFPMICFLMFNEKEEAYWYTLIFSLTAVYLCGYAKSYINGEPLLWGSVRQLLLGAAAVLCAWMIALVFYNVVAP